jgi:hypothetical protein
MQDSVASYKLLVNVAEQLKLPFLQILNEAELAKASDKPDLISIETSASNALKLLDNYLLGLRLNQEKLKLEQEPISVAAVLYDSAQMLENMAKQYSVELELNIAGRFGPVLAHKQGLQSAIVSLGTSLIEALGANGADTKVKLQLASHRCRYGIVAGVYADNIEISTDILRQGRKLYSRARQPMPKLVYSSGAGIFVADSIFRAMSLNLRASRHHRLYGLGAVLEPSRQLQLV